MTDRAKHLISAVWIGLVGLTLTEINTILAFISLIIGISYQLWKWRKELKN